MKQTATEGQIRRAERKQQQALAAMRRPGRGPFRRSNAQGERRLKRWQKIEEKQEARIERSKARAEALKQWRVELAAYNVREGLRSAGLDMNMQGFVALSEGEKAELFPRRHEKAEEGAPKGCIGGARDNRHLMNCAACYREKKEQIAREIAAQKQAEGKGVAHVKIGVIGANQLTSILDSAASLFTGGSDYLSETERAIEEEHLRDMQYERLLDGSRPGRVAYYASGLGPVEIIGDYKPMSPEFSKHSPTTNTQQPENAPTTCQREHTSTPAYTSQQSYFSEGTSPEGGEADDKSKLKKLSAFISRRMAGIWGRTSTLDGIGGM